MFAAMNGYEEIVQLLVVGGADVNLQNYVSLCINCASILYQSHCFNACKTCVYVQ